MIIIPSHILNSGMSADEMIQQGYKYTELLNKGELDTAIKTKEDTIFTPEPTPAKKKSNEESWDDSEVGILVGPNSKKSKRLNGPYFKLFITLYNTYGNKNGKRNAAWAFYTTVIPILNNCKTIDDKQILSNKILKAARLASMENEELRLKGSTPQFLQGWISNMKWEDYD